MYKIGMSACGSIINRKLFENYKNAGIEAMEISCEPEIYDILDFDEIKELADEFKIILWSCHLPFGPEMDISSADEKIAQYAIDFYMSIINRAAAIGIDKFILHPSFEPIEDEERTSRLLLAQKRLDVLARLAKEKNAIIAVEDLPRSCLGNCSDDILKLISANADLRVCFDTNHLLGEDNIEFIKKVADKIITLHVSDYDFINERHWLPGEGKINWNDIIDALSEIGYDGVWMYEIGPEIPDTIIRTRELVCEDFYRNAHEIFERRKPTIFSTPKENLGFWS